MIKNFDLAQVQKSSAVFNPEKLNWFNREYIKLLDIDTQKNLVREYLPEQFKNLDTDLFDKLFPSIIERIEYFDQVRTMAETGEYDYVIKSPVYDIQKAIWKTCDQQQTVNHLQYIHETLSAYTGEWNPESLKSSIWDYAQTHGAGNVLWPVRYSLTGRDKSPDPFTVAYIIGRDETLQRIKSAIEKL